MTVGDRIKKRRNQLNLTMDDLARELNTIRQTIFKYENNIVTNIPLDKLERIAKVLKVSPAYLMGWDNITVESIYSDDEVNIIKKYRQLDQRGQAAVLDTLNREYAYLQDDTVYMVARSGDRGQKTLDEEESRLADEATAELEKAVEGKHQDL